MRRLEEKVAVIAGGAGGIGTAVSLRLGTEGACVLVGDRDAAAAEAVAARINAAGGTALARRVDIADEVSVAGLVTAAVDAYGGIDIVHVNAADTAPEIVGRDTDALGVPLEVFDRTMEVNLRGHLLCTRYALPELLARGGGALIYTSSAAAFIGEPTRVSYAVSKSGINALVRHVASRWGRDGVRANAIAPGLILTDATRATSTELMAAARQATRSPRLGRPEDVAAMVAMLASEDGEWINGQVLSVDGGATLR